MLFAKKDVKLYNHVLGRGSTGIVLRACLIPAQQTIAAKTFNCSDDLGASGAGIDTAVRDSSQEVACLLALRGRHPNVAAFLGACCHPRPMVLYEFLSGSDMDAYYRAKTSALGAPNTCWRPSMRQGLLWGVQLFRALQFLHSNSPPLIHRDIKPANLMLLADQRTVKLIDFGFGVLGRRHPASAAGHCGTWRYMAPEIVLERAYTHKVDIYSASMVLWFLIAGSRPFDSVPSSSVAELTSQKELRPPLDSFLGIFDDDGLQQVLRQGWQQDPALRPDACHTAAELDAIIAADCAGTNTHTRQAADAGSGPVNSTDPTNVTTNSSTNSTGNHAQASGCTEGICHGAGAGEGGGGGGAAAGRADSHGLHRGGLSSRSRLVQRFGVCSVCGGARSSWRILCLSLTFSLLACSVSLMPGSANQIERKSEFDVCVCVCVCLLMHACV